jgi:hypothetical protein
MKFAVAAVLSVSLLCVSGPLIAADRFETGLRFLLGFPAGEFRRNVDGTGVGMDVNFSYHFPRSIVSTGVSFGFLIYGSDSRMEPLSPTIPELIVKVTTTNALLLGHLFVRVQPRWGRIRPYLEGLAGFHYLTTDTSIGSQGGYENSLSSNNYHDTIFSGGLGGGAQVLLFQLQRRDRERIFSLDLDLGVRWLRGGRAEYLKRGSIHHYNGGVTYDVYRSRTDLWLAGLGLSFSF